MLFIVMLSGCKKSDREIAEKISPPETKMIVGGQPININTRPFQVLLTIEKDNGVPSRGGGSILSPTIIITAAHLFDNASMPYTGTVRAGSTAVSTVNFNGQERTIDTVIIHPSWNGDVKDLYDIAIVRLSQPLFSNSNCQPINCIAQNQLSYQDVGETVTASGWGSTGSSGNRSYDQLRWTHMKVLGKNSHLIPDPFMPRSDKLIYAHRNGPSIEAIGEGDSGGPLTANIPGIGDALIGISSFAGPDGSDVPSAFTKVSEYLSWISSTKQSLEWSISGPAGFCNTATYSISNLPSGATVSWSAQPSGIVNLMPSGNNVTVNKVNDGWVSLSASINLGGVIYNITPLQIAVGVAPAFDIIGMDPSSNFSGGQYVNLHVNEVADSYNWVIGGGTIIGNPTGQYITVKLDNCFPGQNTPNHFIVSVQLQGVCGGTSVFYTESRPGANCNGGEPIDPGEIL